MGPDPSSTSRARLAPGEAVLFIDRKEREYLRLLRPGTRLHIRQGTFNADDLIGIPEGSVVSNSGGESFVLLRPTFASLVPNLPRQAQVIYPKDIGPILLWGDIGPGARVVEVGTGPGALTMALLRAVGPSGEVTSYELRADFAEMARRNVRQFHGEAANWTLKLADARQGIDEREVDRMVIDIAEPWTVLDAAAVALRAGSVLVAYVPTALQVKQFVDEARASGFAHAQIMETLLRFWHVKGLSIRPEHRMVAHTGFVIVCRRLCGGEREPGSN
jgi:tRNA (adenine57-N1/adenine58-N1)-methyltransferase